MKIKIKEISLMDESDLFDAFEAPTAKGMDIKIAQCLVKSFKGKLDMIAKGIELINNRYHTMQEFAELVENLYDISLDQDNDFSKIFSIALGQKYSSHNRFLIKTYMTTTRLKLNPETRQFVFKKVGITFRVDHSDDFERKERYTVEEIKELVKNRQIVILEEFDEEPEILEKQEERYFEFTIHRNYKDFTWDNFFFPYIIMYLEENLTSERIRTDIKIYLYNLDVAINSVLTNFADCRQLKLECERQLNKSNVLTEYADLYKKLENTQKGGITLKRAPQKNLNIKKNIKDPD